MTFLPPDLGRGKVVARLIEVIGDGDDEGRDPDAEAPIGVIRISPMSPFRMANLSEPTYVLPKTLACGVDEDGYLIDPQGEQGVWLAVGDYRVTYEFPEHKIPAQEIAVTAEHTDEAPLDLTTVAPNTGAARGTPSQWALLAARVGALEAFDGVQAEDFDSHAARHATGGPDALTPTDIGAVASVNGNLPDSSGNVYVPTGGGGGGTGTGAVDSVNGRTGDVVLNAAAVNALPDTYEPAIADVTGLTAALEGKVADSDPRLTDARTPTAHNHDDRYFTETESDARFVRTVNGAAPDGTGDVTVAGGGGGAVDSVNGQTGAVVLDAAAVGALPDTYTPPAQAWGDVTGKPSTFAPTAHNHAQSDVTGLSSALAEKAAKQTPADYGTGTPSASTVLYGDGTWKDAPSGGGGDSTLTVKVSAYCTGNGSDEAAGLSDAVDECLSTGAVLDCDVPGEIGLGSTVILGDERANAQQVSILTMVGSLKVKATTAMERLITFSGTVNTSACDIEANGDGKANYAIYGDNFGRSTFGRLHAYAATTAGIFWEPSGNNNAWSIEKLRVTGCGTKHTASATVTGREVTGSWLATGGGAPYTTWTFSTAMPAALTVREDAAPVVIMGDGRFMQVKRVVNSTTIEVFNEDKPMSTTETLTLLSAAVNIPFYGDIGIFSIGNADVRDNPNAAAMAYGGYGGSVEMWAQQNNYAGVMLLERATGISFSHFYTELSGVWLVVRSTALTGLVVGPGANAAQSNWQGMDRSWMNPTGRNKQPMHWIMSKPSGSPTVAAPAIPVDAPELNPGTRNITPGTVQAYRRTSGNYAMRIDNNYTTAVGQVMLAAPETGSGITITLTLLSGGPGHNIEGSSTWTKTGVVGSVMLTYWLEGSTWRVRVTEATL